MNACISFLLECVVSIIRDFVAPFLIKAGLLGEGECAGGCAAFASDMLVVFLATSGARCFRTGLPVPDLGRRPVR